MIDSDEYVREAYNTVLGFDVNGQNLLAINLLAECQTEIGITGDLIEVGVFHGRTAILLGLLAQDYEKVIAIDAFKIMEEITHEDRQVDLDYYGDGGNIRIAFESNWCRLVSSSPPLIIEKDSRKIYPEEMASLSEGARIFSLDGGHSELSTYHDLRLAESIVIDGGILVLDDYFLEDCPAVSVGTIKYFTNNNSKFVPFLIYCGRIFFTTEQYVERYRDAIFRGNIYRWVRFGEFLGYPIVCLIDRHPKDKTSFDADVLLWEKYKMAYLQLKG